MTIDSLSKNILSIIASETDDNFNKFIYLLDGQQPYSHGDRQLFFEGNLSGALHDDLFEDFNGSDIINLNESDAFSVFAYNSCISKFLDIIFDDVNINNIVNLKTLYNLKLVEKNLSEIDFQDIDEIRQNFDSNQFYLDDLVVDFYGDLCIERCRLWRAYYNKPGFSSFLDEELVIEERKIISETQVEIDLDNPELISSAITSIYLALWPMGGSGKLVKDAFGSREKDSDRLNAFNRVFVSIKPEAMDVLSPDILRNLVNKIQDSGLLELASYAYEIGEFVKRRFTSKLRLQRPIYDPDGESEIIYDQDIPWLIKIAEVVQKLKSDPINFSAISYYFPSLITFLIDAIAAIGEYSANRQLSDSELEDPDAFLNSLEKAFGVTKDGRSIFTLALRTATTSFKIKEVLNNSPFRDNISPASPDVFHLRLGAANFYIPPVGIDVNTSFKTGSLVGGAIRQKNTPKFNSGYRETSITMRLFFPNYEEIWGISIDDGSSIKLNENYEIDFKKGGASEAKIDKFLSSLRGLVAAFKYSPILPIKNHYINTVHGVSGVCLSNVTISTVPNFPFVLAVDVELLNFNHSPFLPMIKDFNQAVHWGKYRHYMGRAAGSLHQYVNEGFLLKTSDTKDADLDNYETIEDEIGAVDPDYGDGEVDITDSSTLIADNVYKNDVYTQNVKREWEDGNHIVFYAPAETQTKIFLPDTSSFRTEQEKLLTDLGSDVWESTLNKLGINVDINQSAGYRISLPDVVNLSQNNLFSKTDYNLVKDYVSLLTAGVNTDDNAEKTYLTLMTSFIQQNSNKLDKPRRDFLLDYNGGTSEYSSVENVYYYNEILLSGSNSDGISLNDIKIKFLEIARSPQAFLDYITLSKKKDVDLRTGSDSDVQSTKEGIARAFNIALYRTFFKLGSVRDVMESRRAKYGYRFQEWEVPMIKVELDRRSVIVNNVSVSFGNNFAKMQFQMQDEPTYQHIGGKDAYVSISMTVIGEKELIKIKSMFDHLSSLARLEHATGVIGFLGVKNIVTALCGIKYMMPLNYRVSTKPNYPHVYDVELSLVDFDIFQQKREKLSSNQEIELVKNFMTKKNPFLRIKQMWGAFNSYPDFPLYVRKEDGDREVVGHLDPDFYFRSFEMFDRDVINSVTDQTPRVQNYAFDNGVDSADIGLVANISAQILIFLRQYSVMGGNSASEESIALNALIDDMKEYVTNNNINHQDFIRIFNSLISTETDGFTTDLKNGLLTNYITLSLEVDEGNPYLLEINPAEFRQGDLAPNSYDLRMAVESMLLGEYSLAEEEYVSFDPDEVDFHKLIHIIPATDQEDVDQGRMSAICITAIGTYYGYIHRDSGRFYLTTQDGINFTKDPDTGRLQFKPNLMDDTQTPDKGNTNVNTGVPAVTPLSEYQKSYDGGLYAHLEKMMVDTAYRDISGRMLRAFPTYMLWLIDEGGYFAGAKLFDNFYGLQSVIDFSVVSSEDLLGDTLIIRVSNLYAKLTTPSSTEIINPNIDIETGQPTELIDGVESIVARTLNFSKNILSHMRSEYVSDFSSIRLKPGVRVHLRCGYGSNPNSLQTVFNGVITNVEPGEIVTITAQSDAIELGAVINTTDKKGDSGKIDGGINTGLWLSEPRDLMVRLLSMGASRVREAFSRSTRGTIFSENRFGIRHFGSILYEPTEMENTKNKQIRESVAAALVNAGGNDSFMSKTWDLAAKPALKASFATTVPGHLATSGFSMNVRNNTLAGMIQLWSNFSAELDLEIFKRNIYPGNGTGLAQFLGGDLDDGWLTVSSIVPEDNPRLNNGLARLTDVAWNDLVARAGQRIPEAGEVLDSETEDNKLVRSGSADFFTNYIFSLGSLVPGLFFPQKTIASKVIFRGMSLLGIVRGRGGTNFYRTLGLLSANDDDDIPGFDEVSFKAQTYMRTVWDMFQVCARMLPNYIVAVRPFEDRSTVFYGKPHWLYTSGVVPVTTGYPGDEEMVELDLSPQAFRQPDESLQDILDAINRESNPYADYSAYFESYERDNLFDTLRSDMMNSAGEFAPTSYLSGKIMNFYSTPATTHYDNNQNIVCKMPVTKGKVGIGLHLPVTSNNSTETSVQGMVSARLHRQIRNLPPRYSFPFYSASESVILEKNSEIAIFDYSTSAVKADNGQTVYQINSDSELVAEFVTLASIEAGWFEERKLTLKPSDDVLQLETILDLMPLETASVGIFEPGTVIRMPLPSTRSISVDQLEGVFDFVTPSEVTDEYSFEYQSGVYSQLNYTEWGSPSSPEDEQFYIAMKWPYNPENEGVKEAFKTEYGFDQLYGEASDYKERKVLIYSPTTNRAVVCRPAYFMWGESDDTDAIVSPDAAYYLGIITKGLAEDSNIDTSNNFLESLASVVISAPTLFRSFGEIADGFRSWDSGFRVTPEKQECYMGFVPDNVPVGIISNSTTPATGFSLSTSAGEAVDEDENFLIGFGRVNASADSGVESYLAYAHATNRQATIRNSLEIYKPFELQFVDVSNAYQYGGNPLNVGNNQTYFDSVLSADYSSLEREKLFEVLKGEIESYPDVFSGGRYAFVPVSSYTDSIGIEARNFFDEDFNPEVNVIAGNGRTLDQADEIWNEFRTGYHTFDSVKAIFREVYGLDPDSEEPFPSYISQIFTGNTPTNDVISKFSQNGNATALDEFAILLGSDYVDNISVIPPRFGNLNSQEQFKEAIEFARSNYIDAPLSEGGLVEYFNGFINKSLTGIYNNFLSEDIIAPLIGFQTTIISEDSEESTTEDGEADASGSAVTSFDPLNVTPKQLFLLMVGIFRQRLWEDPFARAWLVLKPNKKRSLGPLGLGVFSFVGGGDDLPGHWSFKPVDKVFKEFINPYNDMAKPSKRQKFIQLLAATKSEGNSNTNLVSDSISGIGNFLETNIGPIWSAMTDSLSALLGMFKLNLQQMGYALSEVGKFGLQANILNKVLNDSIYYSLGRPGTVLRAVDNPFTREYGEPVIEIRESFQRVHYLNSFSHILTNKIQENLNGVATVVTAVSDGKYPITVALDKGAPSERQVEKTVETGIYFDNHIGSGLTGILHPLFHPIETARANIKNITGNPDELLARRIALAHLKESIKDIYGGELIIIGNSDIRPHDLVYIADVYERIYGMFEVEQVVHHFTPELGFITSVTPNALVTVNDPARWFISSWIDSWFNVQTIRNDTRMYLDNIRSANSGISIAGNISLDALSEALTPQIMGGVQFTHGSSALSRDLISNQMAQNLTSDNQIFVDTAVGGLEGGVKGLNAVAAGIASAIPIFGQLAWKGWKYVRDNLLDQHGCYVQYLNKNGQPMDAGLSYNQGMVVGRYHTKAMLPGILGVRTKVRTPEGYAYIRTDDIFKSLGWQEKDITGLARYLSYENALVHARVLKLAGLGPEKAGLQPQYKLICKVSRVIDGDTLSLVDCITGTNLEFNLRFTGIDTSELNDIRDRVDYSEPGSDVSIIDIYSPAGKAKVFVENALKDKIFIVTVSPVMSGSTLSEGDYYPGAVPNNQLNYDKDQFDRVMGTIFYYFPENVLTQSIQKLEGIIRDKIISERYQNPEAQLLDVVTPSSMRVWVSSNFGQESFFFTKFNPIYNAIESLNIEDFFSYTDPNDVFNLFNEELQKTFNILVYMLCLEWVFGKTNEWPLVLWDEYYDDGHPATLNWELVVNNLARVYTKDLLRESDSVIGIDDGVGIPEIVSDYRPNPELGR